MNMMGFVLIIGSALVLTLVSVGWPLMQRTWKVNVLSKFIGAAGTRMLMAIMGIAFGVLGGLILLDVVSLGSGGP